MFCSFPAAAAGLSVVGPVNHAKWVGKVNFIRMEKKLNNKKPAQLSNKTGLHPDVTTQSVGAGVGGVGGGGTGQRKGRAAFLFQAVNPKVSFLHSFDLLAKALSRLQDCHSYGNTVIIELSKVIEMCLNHGILLSFKDPKFYSKCLGKRCPKTPLREGEASPWKEHTKGPGQCWH